MKRIIHLSDLHFGRVNPDLVTPLVDLCNALEPDLLVVSGDFTQRARESQYEDAAAFLDRIEAPTLSVPGNHDTPLDNLFLRFFRPWHRYKRFIDRDLEPVWRDDTVTVVGVNTVNRFSWQRGRMSHHTIARLRAKFGEDDAERVRVAVLHHPLEHLPEVEKRLMRGAREAVAALGDVGTDVVLSGHLHNANVAPLTAAPGVLFVQAGTGLSTRLRGERNTFNVLTLSPDRVEVERYVAKDRPEFHVDEHAVFTRSEKGGWRAEATPPHADQRT